MMVSKDVKYDIIHSAQPVLDPDNLTLAELIDGRPVLFVVDRAVHTVYGERLRSYADRHLNVAASLICDGGEGRKTWAQVESICSAAIECRLARHGIIAGVGGGVTLDISGFAASIYRRGISYLRIPTTLIGQVDVSIGIKQGINAAGCKNILGSFYPPMASLNDLSFLRTLHRTHIAGGLAEIIKMAILRDASLFEVLEDNGAALLQSKFAYPADVAREVMERAEIAMLDELRVNLFENDLKRLVDFGHTFSPALEKASGYRLPHGYAVALDMLISTSIAVSRGKCPKHVLSRLLRLYDLLELPLRQEWCSAADLYDALDRVREHRGGELNLVLPTEIGGAIFVQQVSIAELDEAHRAFGSARQVYAGTRF